MTIGQTLIQLSTVVEHALRRAGVPAEAQTPEIIDTAKNNLFFILTNFANKGMTYWCIDDQLLTITEGLTRNRLPDGTVDVLNTNYRRNTVVETSLDTADSTSLIRDFGETATVTMIKLDSSFVGNVTIAVDEGAGYYDHSVITHNGTSKWYVIDPTISAQYIKLYIATGTLTVTELVTVSSYTDVPMYRMNRDQYATLPNKHVKDHPLQFMFDRQVSPEMVLWPSPSAAAETNCIQIYRNHQIADVGSLTESLEIPNRWYEATIWGLAQNMAVELPGTKPDRIQLCMTMADKSLNEAQVEERDNSPISFSPNIGVYTA